VFHMPVRLGTPQYVSGLADVVRNPIYATGVGLLLYAGSTRQLRRAELSDAKGVKSVWQRMRSWFQGNF
jgi:cell division protein FtsA